MQKRWYILGHIPMDEGWTGATDVSEGSEVSALPKGMAPQTVQFFDFAIVLGLSDRQEDQFDAQRQTQPNELPENARCFVPSAEGRIVVELQKVRDSKGFPGMQAVSPDRFVTFVGGNRLRASACAQIQCMKGIDLETVFQIPAGPIQRMQAARHHLQGFGKILPFPAWGRAIKPRWRNTRLIVESEGRDLSPITLRTSRRIARARSSQLSVSPSVAAFEQ